MRDVGSSFMATVFSPHTLYTCCEILIISRAFITGVGSEQ